MRRSLWIYRGLWVVAALAFANVKVDFVWNLSDTLNGLMAIPNLIGLLLLAPMVFQVTREYFEKDRAGQFGQVKFVGMSLSRQVRGAMTEIPSHKLLISFGLARPA